ncbi:MAG TPA: hypothetical protein VM736_06450, partial [Gemmatimonadales bacterium]|nr:hypothetical protein [Gemmatimonadales bacterium]
PLPLPLGTAPRDGAGPSLHLALDGRFVGPQWLRGDEANVTARLSAYAVADGSLTARWGDVLVRGTVGNVFNRRYFTFGTFAANPSVAGTPVERWVTPGLPRHVQISVSTEL